MKPYAPIRGRGVDGGYTSPRYVRIESAMVRRDRADAGLCINSAEHGKATHGVRCKRCKAVHRYGATVVTERGLDALDLKPGVVGRPRKAV